jgi:hypothetical protein
MIKGLEFEFRWGKEISLLHIVQTDSEANPASYAMALSPGVKQQRREADHSLSTSAKVKKTGIYISTPPYIFMA